MPTAMAGSTKLYRPATPTRERASESKSRVGAMPAASFFDVHHKTASPIALEVLEQIAALFAIEGVISGAAPQTCALPRAGNMPSRGWID